MATGTLLPHNVVIGAHIFQHHWSKYLTTIANLSNINDTQNGLLLYKPVEWAFDNAKMCVEIVDGEMKFCLLSPELKAVKLVEQAVLLQVNSKRPGAFHPREADINITFGDLDGKPVCFLQNLTMQPSRRLLILHAIASWSARCSLYPDINLRAPAYDDDDLSVDEGTKERLKANLRHWKNAVGTVTADLADG
jgi:hypothetical protein